MIKIGAMFQSLFLQQNNYFQDISGANTARLIKTNPLRRKRFDTLLVVEAFKFRHLQFSEGKKLN